MAFCGSCHNELCCSLPHIVLLLFPCSGEALIGDVAFEEEACGRQRIGHGVESNVEPAEIKQAFVRGLIDDVSPFVLH